MAVSGSKGEGRLVYIAIRMMMTVVMGLGYIAIRKRIIVIITLQW